MTSFEAGTYQPSLALFDFGELPCRNHFRDELVRRTAYTRRQTRQLPDRPAEPADLHVIGRPECEPGRRPHLPDSQRDVQFTVNGQFQLSITARPGQTEIWVLANVTAHAFMNVAVRETATGKLTKIRIVGIDGDPPRRCTFPRRTTEPPC